MQHHKFAFCEWNKAISIMRELYLIEGCIFFRVLYYTIINKIKLKK